MHNKSSRAGGIDPLVFYPAAAVVAAFVVWGVVATDGLASTADSVLSWLISSFGWLFVLSTIAFVAFAIFLGVSRYGKIRLGPDGEAPEFRKASWVAMMFSAGMGIGLMFYGVARADVAHGGAAERRGEGPIRRKPRVSRWSTPTSTGRFIRGPPTRSSAWRLPTSCTARARRT